MKRLILLVLLITCARIIKAQDLDSLANMLDEGKPKIDYAFATFKATRIINGHSVEQMSQGQLDFRIHHRLGSIDGGFDTWYGLASYTTTYFSLEYGVTDWAMGGMSITTENKTALLFGKFRILRQCTGDKNIPFSLSYLVSSDIETGKWADTSRTNYFSSRVSYVHEIMIARKFNKYLSLQLSGLVVHRNLVATMLDKNDVYAVGIGGRIKITHRLALTSEYYYSFYSQIKGVVRPANPLAFGIDIETGGHVFQLMITNSTSMMERGLITNTTDKWNKRQLHFGFNISRVFSLYSKNK